MYRGYKTYRHFLNAKLHALSAVICGDDELLNAWLEENKYKSVKEIPQPQARQLYEELLNRAKPAANIHRQILKTAGQLMSDKQHRMIVGITKYEFGWSAQASLSFALETLPHRREKLSAWEIENGKIGRLYQILTGREADKLIKRLTSIKQWNGDHQNEKN